MTQLSYEYTATNGEVKTFTSYTEVKEEVAKNGGQYKPIYTRIYEKPIISKKQLANRI